MADKSIVERLREYGGEVLHARYDDFPPGDPDTAYSNEYLCGEAALDAADELQRVARGVLLTREQLEAWVGRELTDDQVAELDECIPNSSIPEAVATIAWDALKIGDEDDD